MATGFLEPARSPSWTQPEDWGGDVCDIHGRKETIDTYRLSFPFPLSVSSGETFWSSDGSFVRPKPAVRLNSTSLVNLSAGSGRVFGNFHNHSPFLSRPPVSSLILRLAWSQFIPSRHVRHDRPLSFPWSGLRRFYPPTRLARGTQKATEKRKEKIEKKPPIRGSMGSCWFFFRGFAIIPALPFRLRWLFEHERRRTPTLIQ